MIRKILLLILLLSNISVYSVNDNKNIDSLILSLHTSSDSKEKVELLIAIAIKFSTINCDKSIYYGSEAISLAKKIKYYLGYSKALGANAYSYYLMSNYASSMELYLKKLKLDDSLGNRIGMAYTNNQIGLVFYYTKEYKKALDYFNKGVAIYKELNEEKGVGNIYTNIGNVYESNNELQRAEYYYITGLDIHKRYPNKDDIAISYNNLGILYFKHYKDTSASQYFIKALKCLPDVSEKGIYVLVYNNYGDFFLWRNQLDSALYYLNKGFALAQDYSLPIYTRDISKSLSILYSEKKDFEKAFRAQKIYENVNDSLFGVNTTSKLAFLDYQYNQDRIENQRTIEFLKQKRKIKVRLWIFIIITILAGSFAFLFIIYHRYKIKQEKLLQEKLNIETIRLKEQLDFRNKEIVIFTLNLFERNELIRQVIQKLRTIYPLLKLTNKPLVEDVIHDLKGKYHENILNEFEHRFMEVHSNFYKNISKKYPDLTANDLRLCAFLKMNMNTKDIANITHQCLNSIEVSRTRLRKKLNIRNSDVDLVIFLSGF